VNAAAAREALHRIGPLWFSRKCACAVSHAGMRFHGDELTGQGRVDGCRSLRKVQDQSLCGEAR
jgi:hypothetical protein